MSHPHHITDSQQALDFITAGKAVFTLVSKKTGNRKTFKVNKPAHGNDIFFVGLLTGPDNNSDYQYLGFMKKAVDRWEMIAGNKGNANHPGFKAIDWTLGELGRGIMPSDLEFWHEGRCARCARLLTDPVSIELGLGPECRKKP